MCVCVSADRPACAAQLGSSRLATSCLVANCLTTSISACCFKLQQARHHPTLYWGYRCTCGQAEPLSRVLGISLRSSCFCSKYSSEAIPQSPAALDQNFRFCLHWSQGSGLCPDWMCRLLPSCGQSSLGYQGWDSGIPRTLLEGTLMSLCLLEVTDVKNKQQSRVGLNGKAKKQNPED